MKIYDASGRLLTALTSSSGVPTGVVVEFDGTIANIPSGYVICDGNNGTVNRLGRFPKQVDTAITEAGTTGGATSKNAANRAYINRGEPGALGGYYDTYNETITIIDIRPLYIDTLYIMKT